MIFLKVQNENLAVPSNRRRRRSDPSTECKGKGMVLYSAVSNPLDRSKRFTLSNVIVGWQKICMLLAHNLFITCT